MTKKCKPIIGERYNIILKNGNRLRRWVFIKDTGKCLKFSRSGCYDKHISKTNIMSIRKVIYKRSK